MTQQLALLAEAASVASQVAAAVHHDQLDAPTHCRDWDGRALVNHWVAYTGHGSRCRAHREDLPAYLAERDVTVLPGWADDYAAVLQSAVHAWNAPEALDGQIDVAGMELPATEVLNLLLKETVLHTWDVAVHTHQSVSYTEELGHLVWEVVERHAELYRQYGGFAASVTQDPAASSFDRALCVSGRDPARAHG